MTFHISIISSETTGPIGTNLYRNDVCEVFYKESSFLLDPAKNMAMQANWCFTLQIYFSKTAGLNGLLHSTNDVCKVFYKDSSFSLAIVKKTCMQWEHLVPETINFLELKQCINKQGERFRCRHASGLNITKPVKLLYVKHLYSINYLSFFPESCFPYIIH